MWASNAKTILPSLEKSTLIMLKKYTMIILPLTRKETILIFIPTTYLWNVAWQKKTTSVLWTSQACCLPPFL